MKPHTSLQRICTSTLCVRTAPQGAEKLEAGPKCRPQSATDRAAPLPVLQVLPGWPATTEAMPATPWHCSCPEQMGHATSGGSKLRFYGTLDCLSNLRSEACHLPERLTGLPNPRCWKLLRCSQMEGEGGLRRAISLKAQSRNSLHAPRTHLQYAQLPCSNCKSGGCTDWEELMPTTTS